MIQKISTSTISNGFVSTRGLQERNLKKLRSAARGGEIVRLRNGVYATPEALADSMVDVDMIVPDGILCLWSAWAIHGLTTQIPNAFYVAVESKRKVTLPNFPEFKLVYRSRPQLDMGVANMEVEGYKVKVYDVERSVCDAIKYRNKIGIDVMAEILQNYLRSEGRDLNKLLNYAKPLRVANILNKYLEAWQ